MKHDASLDWYESRFEKRSGYCGSCLCGWRGPVRGEDREWAQDDCTAHEREKSPLYLVTDGDAEF